MPTGERTDVQQRHLIFSARARRDGSIAAGVLGFGMIAGCSAVLGDEGSRGYILAHGLVAAPYLAVGMACARPILRHCPADMRAFWRPWFASGIPGLLATAAVIGSGILGSRGLLAVGMLFLILSTPLQCSAIYQLSRTRAGQWSLSVDLADATMTLVVLGAPSVLLAGRAVSPAEEPILTLPFLIAAAAAPAILYLSVVNAARFPRGDRDMAILGVALAAVAIVNVTLQLARVGAQVDLPLAVVLTVHTGHMALLFLLALWAPRQSDLPAAARSPIRPGSPMPYAGVVVLPVLGSYLLIAGHNRPWELGTVAAAAMAVVTLNALRHRALTRETQRLSHDLARLADEQERLLTGLLRELETDRNRMATELHSQTVRSMAVLGSLLQTANTALPLGAAETMREAVTSLQHDLTDRAEGHRRLMVAMRSPTLDAPAVSGNGLGGDGLATPLLAFANDLYRGRPAPRINVHIDPKLHPDWSTATITYRIAQEALLDIAHDSTVTCVEVTVVSLEGGTLLEIHDDGESSKRASESRLSRMQLFASLGRGDVSVVPAADSGHVVRSWLGLQH